MTSVLIKRGNVDINTHTHAGKMPYEDEGRDQGNAAKAKECQKFPANHHHKLGKSGEQILPQSPQEEPTLLILFFLISRLQKCDAHFCCLSHCIMVPAFHGSPSKLGN